jgi:hypothetical protein
VPLWPPAIAACLARLAYSERLARERNEIAAQAQDIK